MSVVSPQSADHYRDTYWNDLPEVLTYLCRRATGNGDRWWIPYVKERYATPPRERALVIACGTGWVERDLFDQEIALSIDAFDPNPDYIEEARAARGSRRIRYFESTFEDFPLNYQYDLIVNVAALHHARYLYAAVARLSDALDPSGVFVNWDYVGPARNQYSNAHVRLMENVNRSLPSELRSPHPLRPNLRTIVKGDPTEAAHAHEIRRAVLHYFDLAEWNDLGGGIAYQILWNNTAAFENGSPDAARHLGRLITLDEELTESGQVPSLFAFFVARARARRAGIGPAWDRRIREPVREWLSRNLLRDLYLHDFLLRLGMLTARSR